MSVLNDILNGFSPAMGPYREAAIGELAQLRAQLATANDHIATLTADRDDYKTALSEIKIRLEVVRPEDNTYHYSRDDILAFVCNTQAAALLGDDKEADGDEG